MKINISSEFGVNLGGRFTEDGPFNGEKFRKTILVPALKKCQSVEKLTIVLDGVVGLPSSFLEEAFGGLVRVEGFTAKALRKIMNFESKSRGMATSEGDIWSYIDRADGEKNA